MDSLDGFDISIEGISALKQAQIQNQFAVKVIKGANEQNKAIASAILNSIEGKGTLVDVSA